MPGWDSGLFSFVKGGGRGGEVGREMLRVGLNWVFVLHHCFFFPFNGVLVLKELQSISTLLPPPPAIPPSLFPSLFPPQKHFILPSTLTMIFLRTAHTRKFLMENCWGLRLWEWRGRKRGNRGGGGDKFD